MSDKNGGNPRLDRIERMIEGLTKAHAQFQSDLAGSHAQFKREMAEQRTEYKREIAEHRAEINREMAGQRTEYKREMTDQRAEYRREMAEHRAAINRDMRQTREHLRRWAALGVKEARSQRRRHREIDLYITRLAAAQLVTEEKLKGLLSSLGNGHNGGGRKSE
jgi:hypothetical protein